MDNKKRVASHIRKRTGLSEDATDAEVLRMSEGSFTKAIAVLAVALEDFITAIKAEFR